MRKRYLITFLAIAVCMCGCQKGPSSSQVSLTENNDTAAENSEDGVEPEENEETVEEYVGEPVQLTDSMRGTSVIINPKGEILEKVNLDSFDPDDYEGPQILMVNSTDVYYYIFKDDGNGDSIYEIGYRDTLTGQDTVLTETRHFSYADTFDGMIVLEEYDYSTGEHGEIFYNLDTHEMVERENEIAPLVNYYSMVRTYYNTGLCMDRALAERGCVMFKKDDAYHKYIDGSLTEVEVPEDMKSIEYYNADYLVYSRSERGDYNENELVVYNWNTKESKLVTSDFSTFMDDDENGNIYWIEADDTDYGRDEYKLIRYNLSDNKYEQVVSERKMPGSSLSPVAEGFTLIENSVYFLGNTDEGVTWKRCDIESKAVENVGDLIETFEYKEYGTVEYKNIIINCDKCGEPLYKYYNEYFQFNDSLMSGDAKEKINSFIEGRAEDSVGSLYDDVMYEQSEYESDCENHGTIFELQTFDSEVTAVYTVGSDYAVVNTSGYWYGGGAHGYPSRTSTLFNIKTGEEVGLSDLFTGEEWELKDIVATATKADYEFSQESSYKYFAVDAQSCYQDAYDSISLDYCPVQWNPDGVVVMFPPYELGSFAAGFICVDISYETLGIKDKILGVDL